VLRRFERGSILAQVDFFLVVILVKIVLKSPDRPLKEVCKMSYLTMINPDDATGNLKATYDSLQEMFQMVPKLFVSQSIRPDLLEPIVLYIKRLMIEDHGLSRAAKELIAAYVSKINACAY
jgi:hypothetical protein